MATQPTSTGEVLGQPPQAEPKPTQEQPEAAAQDATATRKPKAGPPAQGVLPKQPASFYNAFADVLSTLAIPSQNQDCEDLIAPIRRLLESEWKEAAHQEGSEAIIAGVPMSHFGRTPVARSLLVTAIGQFFATILPPNHLEAIGRAMKAQICAKMKMDFLKFRRSYAVCLSLDLKQARIFTLQSALQYNYPLLGKEGRQSLIRPPVIYGTEACSLFRGGQHDPDFNWGQPQQDEKERYAWELLQSSDIFKKVAQSHRRHASLRDDLGNPTPFPTLSMDLSILEQEIQRDKARGNLPAAVFASPLDDLKGIRKICDRHHLWLHVFAASSTLLLACAEKLVPAVVDLLEDADSLSAMPFEWFGFPREARLSYSPEKSPALHDLGPSTCLTFLRSDKVKSHPNPFLMSKSEFSKVFDLWHVMQTSDIANLKRRVDRALSLCHHLREGLHSNPEFTAHIAHGELLPEAVFFQIVPTDLDLSEIGLGLDQFTQLLMDRCHEQMSRLHLTCTEAEGYLLFQFQPLFERDIPADVDESFVDDFLQSVSREIRHIKCTLERRTEFREELAKFPDLNYVPHELVYNDVDLIGLGAFHFMPPVVSPDAVASINKELHRLLEAQRPGLFVLGQSAPPEQGGEELACIVVGYDKFFLQEGSVPTICAMICKAGAKLQYPPEVLNKMSDAVIEGIAAAQKKLDENANLEYGADDLVRSIPLVGGLYSWFSPREVVGKEPTSQQFDMISLTLKTPNHNTTPKVVTRKLARANSTGSAISAGPRAAAGTPKKPPTPNITTTSSPRAPLSPQQAAQQQQQPPLAPRPRVAFVLGGPGAGKGTTCSMLVEEFGCVHLSAGDLLRAEKNTGSKHAALINQCQVEGKIVPSEITVTLIKNAMQKAMAKGISLFVIDGFPRNMGNLTAWEKVVGTHGADVQFCMLLTAPEEILIERLLNRGKTSGRKDDNVESIKKRLRTYRESTLPIVNVFRNKQLLREVQSAPGSVEEVYLRVREHFLPLAKTAREMS